MLSIVVYIEGSEEIYVLIKNNMYSNSLEQTFFGSGCDGRQKGVSPTTNLQKKLRGL